VRYDLVMFDFDGTLADSLELASALFEKLSYEFHFRKLAPAEREEIRDKSPMEMIASLGIPLWKMPRIISAFRTTMAKEIKTVSLFKGTDSMLRQLAVGKIQLGIVSSNSEPNIRHVLGPQLCDLISYFECGASLFGKAARLRRVIKRSRISPARCLYVGDEIRDLEAARKAGIAFGGVEWGLTRPTTFSKQGCEAVFRTMVDLAEELT
jgi:phosphoglycolate phosphatase